MDILGHPLPYWLEAKRRIDSEGGLKYETLLADYVALLEKCGQQAAILERITDLINARTD